MNDAHPGDVFLQLPRHTHQGTPGKMIERSERLVCVCVCVRACVRACVFGLLILLVKVIFHGLFHHRYMYVQEGVNVNILLNYSQNTNQALHLQC